jgi:ADP-dependent NAD(P)H-hydrate dehydratase / NAD(P)H-hydrate epimerase
VKLETLKASTIKHLIPKRPATSNKGNNGHILIIAGSGGMTGAAYLCALGALKAGVGLATVGSTEPVRRIVTTRLPEAMTLLLEGTNEGYLTAGAIRAIKEYIRRRTITTLAVGPGLTVHPSVRKVIKALLSIGLPMVLDADGLNNVKPADVKGKPVVITPHPGELARFLGLTTAKVQVNRSKIAKETAKRLGVICVLKGHRTVVSDGQRVLLNPTGNPAMATGGMGDVLTGVIAAFLAQGLSRFDAACAGVYLHGLAGDIARVSDRGLLASELANSIPKALRKIGRL